MTMNEYNAISAKLKAMYSTYLKAEDYNKFLTKHTVNDVCNYLKNNTSYRGVLAKVDDRKIHRGNMESILSKELYEQYIRLYNFMNQKQRKLFKFWFMRIEIEFLKKQIRYIFNKENEKAEMQIEEYTKFFSEHTKIDVKTVKNAKSMSDFIKACENTPFYELLKTADNIKADFFSIGMMLDRLYYTMLWKAKDELPKKQKEAFAKLLGYTIDKLNIMWVYRGKKYFQFDKEIIYTYLIPVHYSLNENLIKSMVDASDYEKVIEIIKKTKYKKLFKDVDKSRFIEQNSRRMEYENAKHIFVTEPMSMAAVFAYFQLKELEIFNITTIIEGVRYNLDEKSIQQLIQDV